MTVTEWLTLHKRRVTDTCWNCGTSQTKEGTVGWPLPFWCDCGVGWAVKVEYGHQKV